MKDRSEEPFPKALSKLMEERKMGVRELARATKSRGWGSPTTITFLHQGKMEPTIEAMEQVARALEVRPDYFAEYRMAVRRRQLDPRQVGFRKALKELKRLEG